MVEAKTELGKLVYLMHGYQRQPGNPEARDYVPYVFGGLKKSYESIADQFTMFPITEAIVRAQTEKMLAEAKRKRPVVGADNKSGQHDNQLDHHTIRMLAVLDAKQLYEDWFAEQRSEKKEKKEEKDNLGEVMTQAAQAQRSAKRKKDLGLCTVACA